MAEPRSIRGFLRSRRHKHSHADSLSEEEAASTSSLTSDASPSLAMEGMLKKRAAKMPVMHDRYCVATWEMDADDRKCVMLRSYKSRKSYDAHPEKPSSVHQLKCISDWDGKTGFHRYQHAFTMETRNKKLFQCVAPCAADKDKWVELMAIQSAFNSGRDMRLGSVGSLVPLRRTQSVESAADNGKPRAYTGASIGKQRGESDVNAADAEHSTDSEDQSHFPGHDGLFRTTSGASTNSLELPNGDKSEPADWGLYGEANGETKSKYEIQDDAKLVLLDKELLNTRGETKTLASDKFLFEEAGASRFGTVVVKPAGGSDDEDADFIDEEFAAREAQKENEKKMKRRAQKLESNRDLYAEMAATRLANMRKDARHPKKSHSRPSDESDVDEHVEDESIAIEGEVEDVAEVEKMQQRRSSRSRRSSKSHRHTEDESIAVESEVGDVAELEEMQQRRSSRSRRSSKSHRHTEDESIAVESEVGDVAELEEMQQRRSSRSRRSSKNHKKSFVSSSEDTSINGGYVSGDDEEVEEEVAPAVMADAAEVESAEAEELRQLKKKYRAERRAKKRLMKEKEEEERTAQEAAELARAHREEQRAREEAKAREEQEKRDKKERREMKEKLKREKAKQRQAEAELRKLVELKQAEEERREREHKEKKEKKKKSKKKEKYTSPAERIHKKEERDAERAAASAAAEAEAQTSNALVVVEKAAEPEPVQRPLSTPEPASTPVPASTAMVVQSEAAPVQAADPVQAATPVTAPAAVSAPVAASVPAPAPVSAPQGAAAMPMYQMAPPPFVPTYPVGPQSMPAYGLAATFGAYPPLYPPAPYSYGGPVGMQPAYMRPNMGFMAGLSAMGSFGKTAGPDPAPSSQDAAEPMIGPQLPTPGERAAASSAGASAPPSPPPPPSSGAKLTNLPELPDVVEF